MKITLPLLILISLFSCKTGPDNSVLVNKVFRTGQFDVINQLQEIKGLSTSYYHNRPDSLINRAEEIIALRRSAGFRYSEDVNNIDLQLLLRYLEAALPQSHLFWREKDRMDFESLIQQTKILLNSPREEIDLLEIVVSVLTIDRLLLTGVLSSFSDGHELLKFVFHYHQNSNPQIGVPFKVFITPQCVLPKKWNVSIDEVSLTRNDDILINDYTMELLGSVAYFEFLPDQYGTYELNGSYSAGIKEEFFEESGDFQFIFEVK